MCSTATDVSLAKIFTDAHIRKLLYFFSSLKRPQWRHRGRRSSRSRRRLVIAFNRAQVKFFIGEKHDDDEHTLDHEDVKEADKDEKKICWRTWTASGQGTGVVKLDVDHRPLQGALNALHSKRFLKVDLGRAGYFARDRWVRGSTPVRLGAPGQGSCPRLSSKTVVNPEPTS